MERSIKGDGTADLLALHPFRGMQYLRLQISISERINICLY
jgi:hypothetical protein